MRIVSDRNIPLVEQAFASLGEVTTLPAAQIDAAAVREADLLLCRTTIKVNAALLSGSKVRFVATATIGTDHLDIPWLEAQGITWAAAPGSNADSVQLWFACALAHYCRERQLDPAALRIGIVGVGHVGSRVERLARALGTAPLRCDPPRARRERNDSDFIELDELLTRSDIVTLHVPLSDEGSDRTRDLIDARRLARMRRGALLVNACRGEVVDGEALVAAVTQQRVQTICDVFPGEPTPARALVDACRLATPHIAGHSLDGKVNGTDMVYRAACAFLGKEPTFVARDQLPAPQPDDVVVSSNLRADADVLHDVLGRFYDITADDRALRALVARGESFRSYRDTYPARREPRGVRVRVEPRRTRVLALLESLGFRTT